MDTFGRKDIALFITNRCNFTCAHCLREIASPDDLPVELLDSFLPQATQLGFDFIAITGGEPILHPQFDELLACVVSHGFRFNFVTNGWLYERYLPYLERYRSSLVNIGVSIDGAYRDTHDLMRRQGSWERVTEAVRAFRAQDVPVVVNALLAGPNLLELEELICMVQDLGAYELWLAGLIPTENTPPDYVLSNRQIRQALQRAKQIAAQRCFSVQYASCVMPLDDELYFCKGALVPQPTVNPLGELAFCCNTTGRGAVVGRLQEHSFGELYGRAMEVGCELMQTRLRQLIQGDDGMRSLSRCTFCHTHLEETHLKKFCQPV